MLLLFPRLLCVWLCSEAVAAQLQWHKPKTTFSPYESEDAQSRTWRTISEADNTVNPSSSGGAEQLESEIRPRGVRESDAQDGALRVQPVPADEASRTHEIKADDVREGGCSPGGEYKKTMHGHICSPGRRSTKQMRTKRSETGAAAEWEPLPAAMAQEQEDGAPFGVNASDYEEEYTVPDFTDSTPFVPVDTRTRRQQVRNPFYPVTSESYGAYAVLFTAAIIFSVGIVGNVSVMCIVCHNYYMRSISNSLLANLALWDFVIIFFCLPLVLFHALTKDWLLGEFSCRIIPYLEVRRSSSASEDVFVLPLTGSEQVYKR